MPQKLALLGGKPIRKRPYRRYITIGPEEKKAAMEVLDRGALSEFVGDWSDAFNGGRYVRMFEAAWAKRFGFRHAVSVNSATSGLYAAVGALGLGPGDEMLVPPFTMTASAAAALVYGAVPIFVDIEPDYFCIDPDAIEKAITPRTKAIMVVHITGQPADMERIMTIARKHRLKVIEDCAQVAGATLNGRPVGSFGDIGVFSLNCHKTIQTGEGGVAVTDDDQLALRLKLIRNHGEYAVQGMPEVKDLTNIVGFNYRLGELEAAIGIEQLKKLERFTRPRIELARELDEGLARIPGVTPPPVRPGARHVYYMYGIRFDGDAIGVSRDLLVKALQAEGVEISAGSCVPLYLEPLYQRRVGIGRDGHPWSCPSYKGTVSYRKGICPNAERLHFREMATTQVLRHGHSRDVEVREFLDAFEKVWDNLSELKRLDNAQQGVAARA